MDLFDAVFLARMQFAFTIGFHIIFPAFTIGLASYLAVLNGLHLYTQSKTYLDLFDYWKKVFAITFGMGVVSGIVMSYQFGTNWSVFADKTGPVLGPLMGYEVLTAFFLEAGFLGVMLFGRSRVGPGLHFLATAMVAIGTFISSFWILAVNSWMQTPAGYAMNEAGQFIVTDWLQVIFNPSFPYRLAHMVLAAYLTTAFVVGAVGAWHLLKEQKNPAARTMFSMAMWMAALVAPVQIFAGDMHGLNTLEYQPRKVAAMEGHFETQRGAPLILFGIPNEAEERMDYALELPKVGSLILTHELGWRDQGPEGMAKGRAPAGRTGLLRLPHHGGHRLCHAWPRPVEPVAARQGAAVRSALDAPRRHSLGPVRLRRFAGRLDGDRSRTAAIYGLWAFEDGGFGLRC